MCPEERGQPIADLYYLSADERKRAPTPRELVLFSNQLAGLRLQWRGGFRLTTLAAYLLQTADSDPLDGLSSGAIPSDWVIRYLDEPNLRADFAALYFNVGEQKEALELLQRPIAETALANGDSRALRDWLRREPSFEHVVMNALFQGARVWTKSEPERLFKAVVAVLDATGPAELDPNAEGGGSGLAPRLRDDLLNRTAPYFSEFPCVPFGAPSVAEAMQRTLMSGTPKQINALVGVVVKLMTSPIQAQTLGESFATPVDFDDGWGQRFLAIISDSRIAEALSEHTSPLILGLSALGFGRLLTKAKNDVRSYLLERASPIKGAEGVMEFLREQVTSGAFDEASWELLTWLLTQKSAGPLIEEWAGVVDTAFSSQRALPGSFVGRLVSAIRRSRTQSVILAQLLKSLSEEGRLHHQLWEIHNSGTRDGVGELALVLLEHRPDGTAQTAWQNSANAQQLLQALIRKPRAQEGVGGLLRAAILREDAAGDWVAHTFQHQDLGMLLTWMVGEEAFRAAVIKSIPLEECRVYTDKLAEVVAHGDEAARSSLRQEAFQSARLSPKAQDAIRAQLHVKEDAWLAIEALGAWGGDTELQREALALLKSLNEDDWRDVIDGRNGDLRALTVCLTKLGVTLGLGRPLRQALQDAIQAISTGTQTNLPPEELALMVQSLDDRSRTGLEDHVYDDLERRESALAEGYWAVAGPLLLAAVNRSGSDRRTLRRIGVQRVTKDRTHGGLKWLQEAMHHHGRTLVDDQSAARDLLDELEEWATTADISAEVQESLLELQSGVQRALKARN